MSEDVPLLPVRRLHNYVYCPRLFYLQWVEDIFVPNEDTVAGDAVHSKVDDPTRLKNEALTSEGGTLRSIALSSDVLRITGVIDLLEHDAEGNTRLVDYKKGSPVRSDSGEWEVKENDAIQLAAYALLLEETGISVSSASVYYAAIKRHVAVDLTEELRKRCKAFIAEALDVAKRGACPPPLDYSSRCLACSAYPVCLPWESKMWADECDNGNNNAPELRPPRPDGDHGEILIVQNNRAVVGIKGGEIQVRLEGELVARHPLHQLYAVYLYGPVQVSAQAMSALIEHSVPVSYFSSAGRFIGMAGGLPLSGVDARIGQYNMWSSPVKRLVLAAEIIKSKIHNQRVILMRNGSVPDSVLRELARLRDSCQKQLSLESLRGVEGAAAALYFSYFSTMLKDKMGFEFSSRNRRPPKDPVNALLSLGYSVLAKELSGIAYTVGLDPFLGFFHSPRYGRPALALDMMEEFRPLIVDSVVLTLINRGEVSLSDFTVTSRGTLLNDSGRRQFWRAWTRRLDTEITHPTFGYKMSYRRMMEVQMRQLWRFCRGESKTFYGFTTR
ncbi:MAG: CRISPR-associated endonuclease Cas1 [Akkermansia sp.]|nr:CRISPR-associated endonuclease Cas1 [Akkermansia sp.]